MGNLFCKKPSSETQLIEDLGQIVIATSREYEALVQKQIEPYAEQARIKILIEPERKNTAPAIAFACRY